MIRYRKGKENPADGLSRKPDYAMKNSEEDENPLLNLLKLRLKGEGEAYTDYIRITRSALLAALIKEITRRSRDSRKSIFNTLTLKFKGEQY